jgi:hypothetical protein
MTCQDSGYEAAEEKGDGATLVEASCCMTRWFEKLTFCKALIELNDIGKIKRLVSGSPWVCSTRVVV